MNGRSRRVSIVATLPEDRSGSYGYPPAIPPSYANGNADMIAPDQMDAHRYYQSSQAPHRSSSSSSLMHHHSTHGGVSATHRHGGASGYSTAAAAASSHSDMSASSGVHYHHQHHQQQSPSHHLQQSAYHTRHAHGYHHAASAASSSPLVGAAATGGAAYASKPSGSHTGASQSYPYHNVHGMHHGTSLSPVQQHRSAYVNGNSVAASGSSYNTGHPSVHSHHQHQYPLHYRESPGTPAQSHFSPKFSEKRVYNEAPVDAMHHGYHRAQHGSYNYPPHDGRVVSASASHAHSYMAHPSSSSYHSMATPNAAAARQQHESPIMTQHRSHVLPSGAASTNGHLATGSRYTVHDYAGGNSGTNRADPRLYYPTDSHDPHINHAHGRINGAGGVHQDIRDPSMANYPGSVYSSHMHDGDIIREAWDRADRRNYTMPSDWHDPSRSGISAAAGYPDIHDERVYRSVPSTATSAATDVHHRRASIVSSGKLASSARADHAHYHSQAQQYQHAHQHPQRSSTTPQPASSSVIPSTASRKSEHVVGAKQGLPNMSNEHPYTSSHAVATATAAASSSSSNAKQMATYPYSRAGSAVPVDPASGVAGMKYDDPHHHHHQYPYSLSHPTMTTTDRSHTRATATGATADTHGMTRSSMPVTATGATAAHGQSEQQWRDARYMQTQSGYRPGTRHEMIEPEMHASVEMTAASTRKPYDHAMLSSNNLAAATAASVYNDAYYTGDDHLPTGAYSKRRASSAYTTMNPHGDNVGAGITLHTAGKSASSNYDHIAESHHEARTEISEDDAANILCSLTQLPATALAINNEPIESPEELVLMAREKAMAEVTQVQLDPIVTTWAAGKRATILAPFDPVVSPYGPSQMLVSEPELAEDDEDDEDDKDSIKSNTKTTTGTTSCNTTSQPDKFDSDRQGNGGGMSANGASSSAASSSAYKQSDNQNNSSNGNNTESSMKNGKHDGMRNGNMHNSLASSEQQYSKRMTMDSAGLVSQKRRASEVGLEESQTKRIVTSDAKSGPIAISINNDSEPDSNETKQEHADDNQTVQTPGQQQPPPTMAVAVASSQRSSPVSTSSVVVEINDKIPSETESRATTPSTESDENGGNGSSNSNGTTLLDVSNNWLMKSTTNDDGSNEASPRRLHVSRAPAVNDKSNSATTTTASSASNSSNNGSSSSQASAQKRSNVTRVEDGSVSYNAIDWSALELPDGIKDQACQLLRDVLSTKDLQRVRPTTRRREALLMALTLILCRRSNIPRTFAELSKASQVPKRDIGACYKWLCATLNPEMVIVRHIEPDEFMKRWCNTLQIEPYILPAAVFCYRATDRIGVFSGKCPTSVAAASIWFVIWSTNHAATILEEFKRGSDFSKMRCSSSSIVFNQLHVRDRQPRIPCDQKTVASVAGVVIATLMSTYKGMVPYVRELSPPRFLEAIVADDIRVVADDTTGFGKLYVLGQLIEMLPSVSSDTRPFIDMPTDQKEDEDEVEDESSLPITTKIN